MRRVSANPSMITSLYSISKSDIKEANQNIEKFIQLAENNASDDETKKSFEASMRAWKRVEALYVAADMDEEYIDIPRYIDTFHQGKENLYKQLDRILLSTDSLDIELFKNSTKSINALEYLLFKPSVKTARQKEMITYIAKQIGRHLKNIETFYAGHKELLLQNEQKMNAVVMNDLIESSYKLKEWRVGDPAGLSRKYKNDPDNNRSEYPVSKLSYSAIEAILYAHQAIIGKQDFANFAKVAEDAKAAKELQSAREHIANALEYLHKAPPYDFSSKEIKALYKELTALHNTYYISLIGALKMTSKILDADGD